MDATAPSRPEAVLREGDSCWRIAHADRFAIIVDAAGYFRAVKQAILAARHSVMLIGWDFDTRIELEPGERRLDGPNRLGPFLRWLSRERSGLDVHVLKWDLGVLQSLGRGMTPLFVLDLMTGPSMRFRLDRAHPAGAAHHQKIVVVDDALAFCGGIDMTAGRWDTRRHRDDDPHRRLPRGTPCDPWHDATVAVDGAAAKAIGELGRERWKRATGEVLEPPPEGSEPWPEDLEPTLTDVGVAIARTFPEMDEWPEIREIEALYLRAIASARRTLYIESQYFAARVIAEAIITRLQEDDPPEFVLVLPESADGWLEEKVMDSARNRLMRLVRRADRHGRFRAYHPVTPEGTPIYVHAKIMVVDDTLLRIGSSNLNNRSTGFDTECDLAVEAAPEEHDLRRRIVAVRDDLLAEHLGVEPSQVVSAIEAAGSLIGAIESLRGEGRTLVDLPVEENGPLEDMLAEGDLVDPERPPRPLKNLLRTLTLRRCIR